MSLFKGGKGLVSKVQKFSNVHVIGHLEGLYHIYVDNTVIRSAKNYNQCKNEKNKYLGAVETLLIEENALKSHGIEIIDSLSQDVKCE